MPLQVKEDASANPIYVGVLGSATLPNVATGERRDKRPSLSLTPACARLSFHASFVAMVATPPPRSLEAAQLRSPHWPADASPVSPVGCFSASAAPSVRPRSDRRIPRRRTEARSSEAPHRPFVSRQAPRADTHPGWAHLRMSGDRTARSPSRRSQRRSSQSPRTPSPHIRQGRQAEAPQRPLLIR
jgi:hypothetical protein